MRLIKQLVVSFLLGVCAAGNLLAENLPEFKMYTEDWSPFQYVENNQLTGFAVDLLEEILKNIDSPQTASDMSIIPWARAINSLETENTLVFSMTVTDERLPKYQWVGPIYDIANVIIIKSDSSISADDFSSGNSFHTALIKDDLGFEFIDDLNVELSNVQTVFLDHSPTLMLNWGRIDFVIDNWMNFKEVAARNNIDTENFKVVKVLDSNQISYAISKNTQPDFVEKMNTTLDQIKKSGWYDQLKSNYGLD